MRAILRRVEGRPATSSMQILSRPPTFSHGSTEPPCGGRRRPDATSTAVVVEQHRAWGRAYRDGSLVCGRVHVTIGRDDRLCLAPRERRYVAARFQDRLHPTLRAELHELTRRRGAAARRAAERFAPIVVVIDDPLRGRERIVGRREPPQSRRGDLRDVEFALRELTA